MVSNRYTQISIIIAKTVEGTMTEQMSAGLKFRQALEVENHYKLWAQ